MKKETVLMFVALIWGVYSIAVGIITVISGYNNDLVWISVITAISGTTGAHAALSMSSKGVSLETSGSQEKKVS
jgi:hypothetical protein